MAILGLTLLATLHPTMIEAAREALAQADAEGLRPIISETLRSPARQDQLYAQGRTAPGSIVTKARAWESAHQYGLALDVTTSYGYGSEQQRRLHSLGAAYGFLTISWDLPHWEHPEFPALLKLLRSTGDVRPG